MRHQRSNRSAVAVLGLLALFGVPSAFAQAPAGPGPNPAAQPPAGEIRGKIVDAKSELPVARASVTLRPKANPAILVTGAIAGPDGTFRLLGLRPGLYNMRTTYIGFAPIVQEVAVTPAAPVVTLPTIKLSRVAVELSTVSVTEERNTVAIEPDRNTYKAKDLAPAATNASEVLDAVPAVQVDADGKVSLRGNENVAVQINGRPVPMRGTQLAAYLKSLPSNIVERIEVVPNPSAKYDPEGMAGILNIVLKSNVDLGLSAGLTTAVSQADRWFGNGNVGYQAGALSSITTFGINRDTRGIFGINDRDRFQALNFLGATNEDIDSKARNAGQNLTSSLDYKVTDKDLWSNAVTLNHRNSRDNSVNGVEELNSSRSLLASYVRPRDMEAKGWMADYNMAWKRTMEPRKHELSAEARYNYADDDDENLVWRQSGASQTERQREVNRALSRSTNAQVDYMKTWPSRSKIETGFKGTVRRLDRAYLVEKDLTGSGAFTASNQSNDFEFDENVSAVYAVFSQGAGKFDLQAGLRGEHAERDFKLASSAYPYRYNSLYPSGVVNYNASDALQLKVSYSRRVRRPGTQELNPFVQYFDVQNAFIGNPALAPEYTNAFEGGVVRTFSKGNLQFSPYYRQTTNIIRVDINPVDTIAGREITTISFKNLAKGESYGADMNGSLRLGPKLNGFANFSLFKMVTDGGSTSSLSSDAVTWSARVNATSEVTKKIVLIGSYFYRAPTNIERGRFEATHAANVAFRYKLDGDNSNLTLRVNDPFNTNQFRVRVGDDRVTQITQRNFSSRMVWLAFNYSYGRPPRLRQPTAQEQQQGSSGFSPSP